MTGIFGMHRRSSIWYAQAQVTLVSASAGHFDMRRRRSIFHAQARVRFSCACAAHFLFYAQASFWRPITQVSFETHFNFFSGNLFFVFQTTYNCLFFLSKFVLLQLHLIILEWVSRPLINLGQQVTRR